MPIFRRWSTALTCCTFFSKPGDAAACATDRILADEPEGEDSESDTDFLGFSLSDLEEEQVEIEVDAD